MLLEGATMVIFEPLFMKHPYGRLRTKCSIASLSGAILSAGMVMPRFTTLKSSEISTTLKISASASP